MPGPQAADQLIDEIAQRAAIGHAAFDAFGHELARFLDAALAVAVLRALDHRAHASPCRGRSCSAGPGG